MQLANFCTLEAQNLLKFQTIQVTRGRNPILE
jgi:hypothetical protein